MKVACSKGVREVLPGMKWRDMLTGSLWEVVELTGDRIYSPSGLGGTPNFWCRCLEWANAPKHWKKDAREDGCISFCGDSIAAMLVNVAAIGEQA